MKKFPAMILKREKVIYIFLLLIIISSSSIFAQSFKVFAVSDLSRVYEDGFKLPPASDTIKVFGIRGEIISAQCALSTKINLTNLTAEVSIIKNTVTGDLFPAKSVEWNFVGSIPLPNNTPNQPERVVERKAPAWYPDYLMAEKQVKVNKGMYQSIWFTIMIPENAKAGTYTGNVSVKCSQGEQSLPLSVTVYPLSLPSERHLKVTKWFGTNFTRFHGIQESFTDEWFAMLRKYADNMVAHRQNVFRVPMSYIQIQKTKDGELQFDFTRFDQFCQLFWDTKKMDYMETGFLTNRGEKRWNSTEIFLNDFNNIRDVETGNQITMPGKDVIPQLLPAFERHLRQKGWLDKTYFHIMDEPSHHNAIPWKEVSAYMHSFAPDLKRMDAIETFMLLGEIEVAVPKLDHFVSWYDEWKKAMQNGTEVWFYTVGTIQSSLTLNKTIDMPVIESRTMHWLNYKYDATGYLHWGYNVWTDDPYKEVGRHLGDGWQVYPVKDGVLNSLRWEQLRNGVQDYECFWMLENRISALKDSLGSRLNWIDPRQRSKEIASQVIIGLVDHSNDPDILYKAKKQLLDELVNFNTSPMIYVQTNPAEHSIVTNQTRVGVCGWIEPGTKVTVNKQEMPVNKQGMFLQVFVVTPRSNIIRVEANSPKGKKEIVRQFTIRE